MFDIRKAVFDRFPLKNPMRCRIFQYIPWTISTMSMRTKSIKTKSIRGWAYHPVYHSFWHNNKKTGSTKQESHNFFAWLHCTQIDAGCSLNYVYASTASYYACRWRDSYLFWSPLRISGSLFSSLQISSPPPRFLLSFARILVCIEKWVWHFLAHIMLLFYE